MTTVDAGAAIGVTAAKADDVAREAKSVPIETKTKIEEIDGTTAGRQIRWSRVVAFGVLPGLALLLTLGAAFLKWQDASARDSQTAQTESVQAARDAVIALLSYQPDTVEKELYAARDLLTGDFKNSYTQLTDEVVIPGAKQKLISAIATVPAAAAVSATADRAVALMFVNQTVIVGAGAPTDTASTVKVTLEKVGNRWLISDLTPV